MRRVRNSFITGLIVSIPLGITIFFLRFVFNFFDGMLRTPVRLITGRDIPGLGMAVSFILIFLVGLLATNILGKRIIATGEYIIERTPLAGSVYTTVKQIVDTFVKSEATPFRDVCLIEWPRREMYCIAFVTGDTPRCVSPGGEDDLINIFIPTTPNPTSGFLVFLPRKDVVFLDIPVEEGLKMVVSGGILSPEVRRAGGAAK